jgi:hypothetical protein
LVDSGTAGGGILGSDVFPSPPADGSNEMSVSAGEIEKAESRAKAPRQYTEEYRLEAVKYYRKAREADPKSASGSLRAKTSS